MRYLLSITLSVLLLVQTFNFGATDILQIGELVEHAQLHSKEYGDSFFIFLTKHYGSLKKDHLATHKGHENLPFKHDQTQTTVNLFVLDLVKISELKNPPVLQLRVNYFYTSTYTSPANKKIFQPPRHA